MAQTLRQILDNVRAQTVNESAQIQSQIPIQKSPVIQPPRGYASPIDVYDQDVGFESPLMDFSPGVNRGMWSVPDLAISHVSVGTLTSSGTPSSTQTAQVVGFGNRAFGNQFGVKSIK